LFLLDHWLPTLPFRPGGDPAKENAQVVIKRKKSQCTSDEPQAAVPGTPQRDHMAEAPGFGRTNNYGTNNEKLDVGSTRNKKTGCLPSRME